MAWSGSPRHLPLPGLRTRSTASSSRRVSRSVSQGSCPAGCRCTGAEVYTSSRRGAKGRRHSTASTATASPNLCQLGPLQNASSVRVLAEQVTHVAEVVTVPRKRRARSVEPTPEVQHAWPVTLRKNALDLHKFPQVRLVRQPAAQKRPLAARTADATPPAVGSNGIAFGPDRRLYVAELLAGRISAVDPATGDLEVIVPMDSPVQSPDDLAFRADSSMYIADLVPGRAWRCSPEGIRWSPTRCRCPTALPASGTGSSPTR